MANEHIRIDISGAEEVKASILSVIKHMSDVSNDISVVIRNTHDFWKSEGAESTREYGLSCADSLKSAADALEARVNSLNAALMVYQGSENENRSSSADLKGGLIK